MLAEILTTGHEIITGTLIDSNSAHIARALEEIGLEVVRHNCTGDDEEILVAAMREISGRADVAVVTGGLGPTQDDITAAAAAAAAGVELVLNQQALKSIEDLFAARRRRMSPSNTKQAMLPDGSECLFNPVGTAPGFYLKINRCSFFFVPGVPAEMRVMLAEKVVPEIEKIQGTSRLKTIVKTVSTFGLAESEVGERLEGFPQQFPQLRLGIRAKFPEIQIKIYGRAADEQDLSKRMQNALKWVLDQVGSHAFSADGRSMEALVGDLLRCQKATLAVAESCTGGLISHWLTNVPGSSDYFLFAGVTYSNDAKINVLGVSAETLEGRGAVDEETVKEMARGARRLVDATFGLATSGIAGPDGGTPDKPVGTVCVALASEDEIESYRFYFPYGGRLMKKKIFAIAALDVLRRKLQDL